MTLSAVSCPAGYRRDSSLITGEELPEIFSAPEYSWLEPEPHMAEFLLRRYCRLCGGQKSSKTMKQDCAWDIGRLIKTSKNQNWHSATVGASQLQWNVDVHQDYGDIVTTCRLDRKSGERVEIFALAPS